MKRKRMIAFWKYDLYPYLLSGEVDRSIDVKIWEGRIAYYIPSYQGYFVPQFILPYEQGIELKTKLTNLKDDKRRAMQKVDDDFQGKLNWLLKDFGVLGNGKN